ncbi:uncharacterized protein LOC130998576 [Salvia miltiorrhiza]|uniref:uncharacterized protein LOC130998576 n=1 Tax=Salvia miltiorrhiza TaxID=226208 RepID=UPI0025AC25BD|nr:uncharacterized protein LOC130998576 [Salvia miltiorrhiza]
MDKSWMLKNRLSDEYKNGVESFMEFAIQNDTNNELMSCPCSKCGNLMRKKIDLVRLHLLSNGMDLTYHTWIWHGERSTRSYSTKYENEFEHQERNFVHEEPIDMVHAAYEEFDNPSKFIKLLEDAEKPLYPGCVKFTKLSAIVKLFNLKAKHSWSDKSFTDLLTILGDMLPSPNELPPTIYDAKKSLAALGMEYEKIHACPNDCVLYRKEYEHCVSCPTCGVSRWKECMNSSMKNSIPAKVLWYFPPIPRFQRMYRNKDISKNLTWHGDRRVNDGYLRHPADSPCWKVVDHRWREFQDEPRHLRLALSADGINPHSLMSSSYSCWPVLLVTYNLPPWLCFKRKFIMLTLLIAGPKQPGNDIDVYLAPLIDDLTQLWKVGVETYDAFRDEMFLLKVVLLWTINDFPAYGNLSGCKVHGYHACPICGENTCSRRLEHSRKISYTGHRRFLEQSHPYRRQMKVFDGTQELRSAPKVLSGRDVLKRVAAIECKWGKMSKEKKDGDKRIWKKKSIFFQLEYWEHLHVRHILDVMHIEKNICESLIGTLLNIPGKTKDGLASRKDLVSMKMRTELAPIQGDRRTYLPAACYTLSRGEKRQVCESLSRMKLPSNYSSNVNKLVSLKDSKLVGLKSHDYHTLMQQLLPVAIRGVLPDNVRYAITRLCFFFNVLCSKVIDVSKLDDIQREIVTTMCLLEKYFLPSFFDIMVHLTVHLVREVRLCGPVWYRWMYPFERYMRVLKTYVRNRNRPEGCMAECYIAEEAVEFCSDYLSNVQTCGIPESQYEIQHTKPLSSANISSISTEELMQAHMHCLANDVEIDPYIRPQFENRGLLAPIYHYTTYNNTLFTPTTTVFNTSLSAFFL